MPTDLRVAVAGTLARQAVQVAEKVLTCDCRLPATALPVPLPGPACEQVIGHLLRNAVAHTPAGTTITITADVADGEVRLSIADQGPGIPAHQLVAIGEGWRADPTLSGRGEGLRRARALLQPVGGRLAWRNGHVGAVFELTLPLSS